MKRLLGDLFKLHTGEAYNITLYCDHFIHEIQQDTSLTAFNNGDIIGKLMS